MFIYLGRKFALGKAQAHAVIQASHDVAEKHCAAKSVNVLVMVDSLVVETAVQSFWQNVGRRSLLHYKHCDLSLPRQNSWRANL